MPSCQTVPIRGLSFESTAQVKALTSLLELTCCQVIGSEVFILQPAALDEQNFSESSLFEGGDHGGVAYELMREWPIDSECRYVQSVVLGALNRCHTRIHTRLQEGRLRPFGSLLPPHSIACRLTACPGLVVRSFMIATPS